MYEPFTIDEHNHRFAAWAATRAASASPLCRFSGDKGRQILKSVSFDAEHITLESLPEPDEFDAIHRKWRKHVIYEAKRRGLKFNDGIAAKLINTYLKVRFTLGSKCDHAKVRALHPPIDSYLLKGLATWSVDHGSGELKDFRTKAWSKFESGQYEEVISRIKDAFPADQPLWKIEEHWVL